MDRAEEMPAGDAGSRREDEGHRASLVEAQRRGGGLAMAGTFIGRFSQLALEDLREPIDRWRRAVSLASTQWFGAESAIATAMFATGRHGEQELLLEQLVDVLRRSGWMRRTEALEVVGASEASVQYTATVAILALLLRDRLTAREFSLLYSPFAPLIPVEELGPE